MASGTFRLHPLDLGVVFLAVLALLMVYQREGKQFRILCVCWIAFFAFGDESVCARVCALLLLQAAVATI